MKVRRSNIATQGWRTLEYAGILIAKPQQDMNNGERLEKIGERDINIGVLKGIVHNFFIFGQISYFE